MRHILHKLTRGIFAVIAFVLVACSGYTKEDGKVYLRSSNEAKIGVTYTELEEADYSTFETIKHDLNIDLAKDKQYVFKGASILEGADPATFEQIKEYYWKDRRHVYLLQFGGTDCQIAGADPANFQVLDNNLWAKDKNNVYYGFDKLHRVNKEKFMPIDEDWGKDDQAYYWHNLRLDSIDYNLAKILSPYYIKDKHSVYFQNKYVKGADASTFVTDGVGSFGHDKDSLYSWTKNEGPITDSYRKIYIENK